MESEVKAAYDRYNETLKTLRKMRKRWEEDKDDYKLHGQIVREQRKLRNDESLLRYHGITIKDPGYI